MVVVFCYICINKIRQMNFTDFKKDLATEFGFSERQSKKILTFLTKKIRNKLLFGQQISLRNKGTFKLGIRQPRKYLHFKKNIMMMSKKSYYLDFKVTEKMSNELKEKTVY